MRLSPSRIERPIHRPLNYPYGNFNKEQRNFWGQLKSVKRLCSQVTDPYGGRTMWVVVDISPTCYRKKRIGHVWSKPSLRVDLKNSLERRANVERISSTTRHSLSGASGLEWVSEDCSFFVLPYLYSERASIKLCVPVKQSPRNGRITDGPARVLNLLSEWEFQVVDAGNSRNSLGLLSYIP